MMMSVMVSQTTLAQNQGDWADSKHVSVAVEPEDKWQFTVAPYLWAAGINGKIGINGFVSEADVPFSKVFKSLDFAGFLAGEARKGNWIVLGDFQYVKNSLSNDLTHGGLGASVDLLSEQVKVAMALGYVLYEDEAHFLRAHVGAQYSYVNSEVTFNGPGPLGGLKSSKGWVDPFIGMKYDYRFHPKWSLGFLGDVGGFGVSSDELWQLMGIVAYDLNPKWKLLAGYRIQSIDYSEGGFLFDVDTEGFLLGAKYQF